MSTEVKPTDWDAEDNMWEPTASGGSSLPSYSSSDIGKALTVGEGSETVQTVIVPEQTVTLEEGSGGVWVKLFEEGGGVDFSFFENAKEGDTAVFTLNGTTTESVAANVYGEVLFPVGDYYVGYASMFEGTGVAALSEPTVKTITISGDSVKPKTVAKWVTPVFVLEKNFGVSTVGESEEDYNALMSAYNEGAILLLKNTEQNTTSLIRSVGEAFFINYDSENDVFTANIAWFEYGSVLSLAFGTYTIDPTATTNRRTKMCSVELSSV